MSDLVHPTPQAVNEAIDRLARTPDGASLYVYLQRSLMAVSPGGNDSALNQSEGQRMFASRLIGLMAKGILESGGRTGHIGSSIGPGGIEQPVVVPVNVPRRVAPSGSLRRVNADTIVPGWNDDPPDAA
jgi:hypothetical protein